MEQTWTLQAEEIMSDAAALRTFSKFKYNPDFTSNTLLFTLKIEKNELFLEHVQNSC